MNYNLSSGVYFVKGASGGALLSTNTGNVYSLNPRAVTILHGAKDEYDYKQSLTNLGLLKITESKNKIEAFTGQPGKSQLDFVWFEVVTDACNERCLHCYTKSLPQPFRNTQAISRPQAQLSATLKPKMKMSHQNWLSTIRTSADLGARECQFIGGEPFLYKGSNTETLLDLAEFAITCGFEVVEIFTNGTLLTQSKIERIKELGIHVAVSLYSIDSSVHDTVTRTTGSHALTMRSIDLLRKAEIPLRIETVLMNVNEAGIAETVEWRKAQGISGSPPDPLRPNGRGDDAHLLPTFESIAVWGLMLEPNFEVDLESLMDYSSMHSCLAGKIVITEYGEVMPCIFTRDMNCGNLLAGNSLEDILKSSPVKDIWNLTKDNVLVCQDCEYRYTCFDCRPLSKAMTQGHGEYHNAPYPRCTYNPYTGEWAQGLWRLNTDGKAFYDRARAADLQKVVKNKVALSVGETGHS